MAQAYIELNLVGDKLLPISFPIGSFLFHAHTDGGSVVQMGASVFHVDQSYEYIAETLFTMNVYVARAASDDDYDYENDPDYDYGDDSLHSDTDNIVSWKY